MSGLAGGLQILAAQLVMLALCAVHWACFHDGWAAWRRRRAHLPAPALTAHAHWWASRPRWQQNLPRYGLAAWTALAAITLHYSPAAAIALAWAADAGYAGIMIVRRRTACAPQEGHDREFTR